MAMLTPEIEQLNGEVVGEPLKWEIHIAETSRDLWRLDGLPAPLAKSEEERIWARENRAVKY